MLSRVIRALILVTSGELVSYILFTLPPSPVSLFIMAELLYGNPLVSAILATNDPFGLMMESPSVSDFSCEVTGTFEFELIQLSDSLR